jgi:hypothetical protein
MKFETSRLEIASIPVLGTVKQPRKTGRLRSPLAFSVQTCWILTLAALVAHAGLPAATANELTWVEGGSDNLIINRKNWDPDGKPDAGNSGVVTGAAQTGYSTGKVANLNGYNITYKETSSLGVVNGPVRLTLAGGTELTFQDNSVLKVAEDLALGFTATNSGGAKLTLAANATAVIDRNLIFGLTGSSGSSPGTLVLQGSSSVSVEGVMEWQQAAGGPEVTHAITLADSAKLTIKATKSRHRNGAMLVINFQQTDKHATPTLTLGDANEFSGENILYQINGEEATLDDPRFDLSNVTLSLVIKN